MFQTRNTVLKILTPIAIFIFVITSVAESNDQKDRQLETLFVLPGKVEGTAWEGVEEALIQDVDESGVYQTFTRTNSTFFKGDYEVPAVHLPPPVPEQVVVPTEGQVEFAPLPESEEVVPPSEEEMTPATTPLEALSRSFYRFTNISSALLPFVQESIEVPVVPVLDVEESTVSEEVPQEETVPQEPTEEIEEQPVEETPSVDPLLDEEVPEDDTSTATTTEPDITEDEPLPSEDDEDEEVPEEEFFSDTSLIFDDFNMPSLNPGQLIRNAQLRLSLGGIVHPVEGTPSVEIEYSFGGEWTNAGSILLDGEASNALNGGYFLFALPRFTRVSALDDFSVRLSYQGNTDVLEYIYVDSLWLEIDTETINREYFNDRVLTQLLRHIDIPDMYELINTPLDFGREESPKFVLRYESQRNPVVSFFRDLFGRKLMEVEDVALIYNGGDAVPLEPQVDTTHDGLLTIQLPSLDGEPIQPGTYTVQLTVNEGGKEYVDSFTFQWGVLAMNTDQARYEENATTTIMLGAVSENGNTLCEANLLLYVIDPAEYIYELPVESTGHCNGNNFTDAPDYVSSFVPVASGTYELYLEHVDENGDILSHSWDTFEVVGTAPVAIHREGPTRINPRFNYPMTLTVTALSAFTGELIEYVPINFIVDAPNATITEENNAQKLTWNLSLLAGETVSFEYTFDAPDISPYLYTLGPAEVLDENDVVVYTTIGALPLVQESFTDPVPESQIEEVPEETPEPSIEETPTPEVEEVTEEVVAPEVVSENVEEEVVPENGAEETPMEPEVSPITEDVTPEGSEEDVASSTPSEEVSTSTPAVPQSYREHRKWQIASDATGSMLLYWASTTIPSGWTCVSCQVSDSFYQRFILGSSTAGTNGGVATHSHSATGAVTASAASASVNAGGGGATNVPTVAHAHTYTPTISTVSNLPPYRELVVIQHNSAGEPTQLPANAIAVFDAAVPSGWQSYTPQNGNFIRGASTSTIGTTAGSSTHTHTITGSVAATANFTTATAGDNLVNTATAAHTHTVTATTSSVNHEPPYREAILGKLVATSSPTDAMIAMWTDEPPTGWGTVSSTSEPFENRFVKAHTSYGGTGGSVTTTHTDANGITSGAPSGTQTRDLVPTDSTVTTNNHTHSVNVTSFSTVTTLPPYRTAIFAKRAGGAPPTITLHTLFESEKSGSSTPSFQFTGNDPDGIDTLIYQFQFDDDVNFDDSPLLDRLSSNETGCSPNCFTNTVTPADTHPFNDNERIRFEVQSSLTSGTTYYWRVRATASASTTWGDWSETRSFTYEAGLDPSKWFQTQGDQFDEGTLTNTATTSDHVVLSVPPPSAALIVYGEGVVQTPRYRVWDGSAWSAQGSAQSVGGTIQWIRTKAGTTRDEYILGTQDASNDVNVQIFNGTSSVWSNLLEVVGGGGGVSDNAARGFDVGYETNSGDALIVYCDGDADPSYRVWNGSSWVGPTTINVTSANNCEYISMASDPLSDEIVMVTRDTGAGYEAFVWDGSAWGNAQTLGSMSDTAHEGIAVEYEESGDQAVVVVSNGGGASFAWAAWTGSDWSSVTTFALGDDFEWGVLKRDVGSDNMALCYIDQDADVGIVRWNGLSWQTNQELDTGGNIFDGRAISCEFEVTSGRDGYLMVPYSDTGNAQYRYWDGSTLQPESLVSTITDSWEVGSVRTGDGNILAYFHDDVNTQYDFSYWNGSTWSAMQSLGTTTSVGAAPFRQPVHIAAQVYQPSQGTIVSDPITFTSVPGQPTWGEVSWVATEPSGTSVLLQVVHGTSCTTTVPDVALAGNSSGFTSASSPLNISGLSTTTYNILCLKATLSSSNSSNPTLDDWTLSWEREPYISQNNYRWYVNTNALTPTDPWPVGIVDVEEDEPITSASPGLTSVLRLRLGLHVENVALATSTASFGLQYATGTCSVDSDWLNVGALGSTTAHWRGYNNGGVSDGTTLTTLLLTASDARGTYEEENNSSSNPNNVSTGNDVEFDWVLEHNAVAGTEYCFRTVTSSGVPLNEYVAYPMVTTNASPNPPTLSKLFDNEKTPSTTPEFEFTTSDLEGEELSYQIQIDNNSTFDSTVFDHNTVTHDSYFENITTPSDKDPFNPGETLTYLPPSALTNGVTYYWRVRAQDPNGSGAWGEWSTVYSFTIDTSLTASAWFQTADPQFDTSTLEDTETSGAGSVVLGSGMTIGTTTSGAIDFDWRTIGNAWGSLTFTDVETSSDLKYYVQFFADDVWENIPDSDLSGNSAGFDSSPVNLLGLNTDDYNVIRVVAVFTDSGASPTLQDWTVNWGFKILPPEINMLFANEQQATTTPTFEFVTSDPQGDALTYQVQWSTTYAFAASTTRTSDTNAGFVNVDLPADTQPFNSGQTIQFTVQSGDAFTDNTTYWWRVRAKDPTGSDLYSDFTDPQSFTVSSTTAVSTWFQTTSEQFLTDSLSGAVTTGAQTVTVATTAIESLVGYGEGTSPIPRYRTWDGTVWSSEAQALSVDSAIAWTVVRPGETREEYLMGTLGTDGDVNVQVYENGGWGNMQEITASVPNTTARGFDIAYENVSGDAIVVACDGDADPTYYIWNGVWTVGGTVNLTSPNSCTWVRLMSDPTSDEIILMARDSSGSMYELFVWDGSGWGNNTALGSMNEVAHEGVTGSYEESGGQAVVAASNGTAASVVWKAWNGSAWSATTTVALGDDFEAGTLVSDVGSDNMALCYVDEDNDIGVLRWTGAAFVATAELETGWAGGNTVKNDRPVDCAFEVGGARDGYIMVAYSDTTNLRYRYWDGASWIVEASISTVQDSSRVQLRRTGANLLQVVAYDIANDRYDYSTWNGTTWSPFQSLETDGVSGSYPYKEPFMIAPRNPGSSATVVGDPEIDFFDGSGPYWQQLSWTDTESGGSSILYQVEYYDGDSWELIPDSLIPGNSTGTSTSPINLTNVLPASSYSLIRPVASLYCNLGTCPVLSDWTITWSAGIIISGTAQAYDQSTNVTSGTVAVALNGTLQVGKTGTISGGTWTIPNVNAAPGNVITVFVNGANEANEAVAIARYDGVGDVSGMRLYERHVTLGSNDATTTPFTNANIGAYDLTNDEDLFHNATGTTLSICADTGCGDAELYIMASSTYQPSGTLTAHDIENNGTLIADGNTLTIGGSWDNNGTTTMGTSTVVFNATSTNETIDGASSAQNAFYNLTFGNASTTATWTPITALDVDNNLTVAFGTLSRSNVPITVAGNLTTSPGGVWSGMASTTFDGAGTHTWSDTSSALQNVGRVVVDGSSKSIQLGSNVKAQSIWIGADDILDASNLNYDITIFGDWINLNTFVPRSGEVIMSATTTNRVIEAGGDAFYDLTFSGVGGSWSFVESQLSISNDFRISTGTVTMPTGTSTVAGSWNTVGGTFAHNNATIAFTSAASETIAASGTPFTNNFFNATFSGVGSYSFLDSHATTSNDFRIQQGSVTFPSGTLTVAGDFANTGGTFNHNSGTVRFTASGARTVDTNASFNSLAFTGSGSWSFVDTSVTALGSLTVSGGTLTLPSTTLTLGGSLANTASINANNGTVLFNSTDAGETISLGASPLYNMTFNSVGGGWTIAASATTTNNFTLSTTSLFTLASGQALAVGGVFTNAVGGASTTWTGSTLSLEAGNYSINTKTHSGDAYGTLRIKPNTDIKMWNSTSTSYTVDSTGSLYSQDHAGVDGDLYVFGSYERTGGTEYWSYATDFDGTALGGSSRQVDVRFAEGASALFTGATVEILGIASASTSVERQSDGAYGITLSNSTLNAEYYDIRHQNSDGLQLLDGTLITSLEHGHFTLDAVGGSLVTVSDTTVDANPALQIYSVSFDTSLGTSSALTTGDGEDTFIFFDDFNDGSINAAKWTADIQLGTITEASGYLRAGGGITSGNYGHVSLGSEVGYDDFLNNSVVWRARNSVDGIGEFVFRGDFGTNQGYKARFDQRTGANGQAFLEAPYSGWTFSNGSGTCASDSLEPVANQWYQYEVTASSTNYIMYRDGSAMRNCTDNTYLAAGEIALQNHYGSYTDYDWVGVRSFVTPQPTSTSWAAEEEVNPGMYREGHVVTGSTVGVQADYVLPIVVNYGTGTDSGAAMYCNGLCNADFSDVRFADANGAALSYWRDESYTASTSATFWVKFETIPASPATTSIYAYYGDVVGYNVSQEGGTPTSYWWFRESSGDIDGEAFDNDTGDPGSIRWDDSSLTITVSGTVYSDDGVTPMAGPVCDNSTQNVRIVVNGNTSYAGSCDSSDGSYSIGGVVVTGDPVLTIYLDTNGGARGSVITRTPTGDISDLDIYQNRIITRHEDSAPLTILNMAVYDADNDADIPYTAATSTLSVMSNTELHIASSSTFIADGDVTISANASSTAFDGSLHIDDSATFVGMGTSTYTIGGSFSMDVGGTFTPASSTVLMNATTTGKTITTPNGEEIDFNALTFNGLGGSWNINGDIRVQSSIALATGTVSGTGDITVVAGSFSGNGLLSMGSGTTTIERTNTLGGTTPWTFANLVLGSGVITGTTTPATNATTTILGKLTISTGHFLAAGGSLWNLAGTGNVLVESGSFVEGTSTVRYSGTGASNILSTTYYNLELKALGGSPTYTGTGLGIIVSNNLTVGGATTTSVTFDTSDPALDVNGSVLIESTGTLVASASANTTIAGNWDNNGIFTGSAGTVTFDGGTSSNIAAGASSFANVVVNGAGAFTWSEPATTTGAFTLTNAGSFTVSSGQSLAVGGTFANNLGGAPTTWTGSVLYLYGSGNYSINASTTADSYATLRIGSGTQIRMWNSSASAYDVHPAGSLYSQDHSNVAGDLYIFGAYTKTTGTDYWSYATDFDGSILGSPRSADVYVASGGSVLYTGGGLSVVGSQTASTTIQNQGSGTYAIRVAGNASTTWSYYRIRNTDSAGLTFSGAPTVHTLSFGDFEVSQNSASAVTVGGTVINQNQAKTFTTNTFATSTGVTPATNVTATGTSVSSWRFTNHSGSIDGESFDSDPNGDPGYLVWDDSAALITISGRVYSDEGVTGSTACDGSTSNIHLRVAGLTSYTTDCDLGTGAYSISNIAYSPSDSIIVYIDGETEKAATVSEDPISNINNMDLYENRVIVRHENSDPLSILDMSEWDSSDDADIPFTAVDASPDTLTLPADRKLIVWTNKEFEPNGNVTLSGGGGGAAHDGTLELYANATFDATGSEAHSIGGSFLTGSGSVFDDETSTFTFTTTGSARTIDTNEYPFYNVVFNGSGSWVVSNTAFDIGNDLTISQGGVTLPSGTTTITGTLSVTSGSFNANGGTMVFNAAGAENIGAGSSSFYNLQINGAGSFAMQGTHATATRNVTIQNGTLSAVSGTFTIGGNFINDDLFTHNSGTLKFTATTSATVVASSSDLYSTLFAGGGSYTFPDTNLALLGSLTIQSGSVQLPLGTMSIGGSLLSTGGSFTHATGTILFNSSDTGETINPGSSTFSRVTFGSAGGGWTIAANATTTSDFSLGTANSFTLASSTRLYVGGVFTNTVGGGATTWTGSTLVIHSGTGYTINTKTTGGDVYNNIFVGSSTALRAWDSTGSIVMMDTSSSFYSQDHAGVPGSLYIYGNYVRTSGTDYWSYATDFDGAFLGGSSRQAFVYHAQGASTTIAGGTLNILGANGFDTTISNQGSGTYGMNVLDGTLNALYYTLTNMGVQGLVLSGNTTLISLTEGNFTLGINGGSLITLASTTLNYNAGFVVAGASFATTTAITGYNVNLVGSTPSAWTFTGHSGNLDGEALDNDGGDACGSVRWDDSTCLLTEQSGYRFRNDDGGEGVPDSEWYDLDWTKRTRVTVTNADAVNYANVAVEVTVPYDSDMQSDFDDLRFTGDDGTTLISHFREVYTASTEATVWVEIPLLATSTDTEIYMYYGNGGVSDASATSTFIFADTFEDGNISEYSGDTAEFSVSGSAAYERTYKLVASDPANGKTDFGGMYNNSYAVAQGQTIRFLQYIDATQVGDETCVTFATQSQTQNYAVCLELFGVDRMSLAQDVLHRDTSGTVLASTTVSYTTGWYEVEIDWEIDDSIFVSLLKDDVLIATTTATDTSYTSGGVGFTLWTDHGAWDIYSSRVLTATEPTASLGYEQVSGGASWLSAVNTPGTGIETGENARVRFLVENTGLPITAQNFELEYAPKGPSPSCEAVNYGDYAEVPDTGSCGVSEICMATSTQITNLESTTDLLGAGGIFTPGQVVEDPSNNTGNLDVEANEYTELEYVFRTTANVADSSYCLRVSNEGTDLDSYSRVAELQLVFLPSVTALSLNAGADITLTGGATTTVTATGTVTDLNGYADLDVATTTIFRSGVGETCSADNNNCYIAGNNQCTFTNCSGTSCDVECSVDIYYHADPTDIGTFGGETWRATLEVADLGGDTASGTAPSIDLLTLRAIEVDSTIDYGTLTVNADTGSYNATTTIENIGNDALDIAIEGTDLTDGGSSLIPVSEQIFATSTFTYSSCVFCSSLSASSTNLELSLGKPASTTPAVTDEIFWGIAIPFGVAGTAHTGTNIFYAIGD